MTKEERRKVDSWRGSKKERKKRLQEMWPSTLSLSDESIRSVVEPLPLPVTSLAERYERRWSDRAVRRLLRSAGPLSRLLPSVSVSNDELDRQVDTDTPVRVVS